MIWLLPGNLLQIDDAAGQQNEVVKTQYLARKFEICQIRETGFLEAR